MRRILAAFALLMGFAAACSSNEASERPSTQPLRPQAPTSQPSRSPAPAAACLTVGTSFIKALGITGNASAVAQSVDKAPGIANTGTVWFVSTKDGATWIANHDPTVAEFGGLVLPLNDKARAASDFGAGVRPGVPAYRGFTDHSAGAAESRTCAGSS
jgi:hypothetical protein